MKKEEKSNNDEICDAWKYHSEADHLFHQRFSFFLVAESFLVLSIVTVLVANNVSDKLQSIKIAISLLGIVFTFGWWYVNLRIKKRLDHLKNKYLIKNPVYKDYMDCVNEPIKSLGIELHINSQILPIATLIFWWFILFEVILDWYRCCNVIFLIIIFAILYLIMPKQNHHTKPEESTEHR